MDSLHVGAPSAPAAESRPGAAAGRRLPSELGPPGLTVPRVSGPARRRFHLLQPGFRNREGILLPVIRIEQLERKHAAEPDLSQLAQYELQRGDAVAGVDARRVGNLVRGWRRRVVVNVDRMNCPGAQKPQAVEPGAALVEVKN